MKDLDDYIYSYVRSQEFRDRAKDLKDVEIEFPVTLTYAMERLSILHIKLFAMEDIVRNPKLTDTEIGLVKRKIDYLNGVQRPRLVQAIGDMLAKAVADGNLEMVREPNNKDYKQR